MVTAPLFSFAIPTYNFADFLPATVHSIYRGAKVFDATQIEVVVVDGASTDQTQDVVSGLMEQYPTIRYFRLPKRGGIDHDLNYAMEQVKAPFTWLLSSDDILADKWDVELSRMLKPEIDIFLMPAVLCSKTMIPMRRNRIFDCSVESGEKLFDFSLPNTIETYLKHSLTLESLFSFMSALVVNTQSWRRLATREDHFGSCWAHCARLIPVLNQNGKVLYTNKFLLLKRSGNDSFMEHGLTHRIGITVNGWTRLIREFFPNMQQQNRLMRLLRRDASILLFMFAKLSANNKDEKVKLKKLAHTTYIDNCSTFLSRLLYLIYLVTPSWPTLAQSLKNFIPKIIWWRHRIKGLFH